MKKITYIFCLICLSVAGQENLSPNKEYYDELVPSYANYNSINFHDAGMPNVVSWDLMGHLNLYEATGDKAYLVKFMNLTIAAMLQRQDIKTGNFGTFTPYPPKWTLNLLGTEEQVYYNTLLLLPMTKFIYLVRNDDSLFNAFLSNKIVRTQTLASVFPSTPLQTYGDFTNWLGERIEETMWFLNANYWDDDYGHLQGETDGPIGALNFQSLFAAVYLYKYKINHTFGYWAMSAAYLHDKIDKIHDLYLGQHVLCNHCWEPNTCHAEDVFIHDSTNYAFKWYHLGWRELCDSDGDHPGDFMKEDVAHGSMDLIFPMADWNTGAEFFTTTEFHNWAHQTFTQNIYHDEFKFYNNVWGGDADIDEYQYIHDCSGDSVNANWSLNFFWAELLNWMPLCAFDNTGNSVYDILIKHAYNLKNGFTSYANASCHPSHGLNGGTSFLGLSEVVKAQWQRECVDLTLGNRDLIYDQNFFAPGSLYIKPSDTTVTIRAFAEPNNDTIDKPDYFFANKFVIEDTVKSTMVASTGIHFYPGFHGKEGCYLHAYINPDTCSGTTNPFHMPTFKPISSTVKNPASLTPETKPAVSLTAVPGGDQLVYLNSPNTGDRNQQLLITDLSGRVIANYSCLPSTFTTSGLSSGLYLFIYSTVNGKATQKVMIY